MNNTKTELNHWHDVTNPGDSCATYTRDTWVIPENGTEIWCTAWKRGQTIKPYGDGCHVVVGPEVYHCDQLMGILQRQSAEGHTWGIDGVKPIREQRIGGWWMVVGTYVHRIAILERRGCDPTGWINDAMNKGEFDTRLEALDHLENLLQTAANQ